VDVAEHVIFVGFLDVLLDELRRLRHGDAIDVGQEEPE
jgi:hypothetical protein